MYASLLSVFLMGMIPAVAGNGVKAGDAYALTVAPPSVSVVDAGALNSLTASGFLVADLSSGQELIGRSTDVRRPIASLTKLMTAIVVVERHNMDEVVTVSKEVAETEGQVVHLRPGEQYRLGDLLSAMLISSANDAAVALAVHHSGSVEAFVREMNARARILGLHNTSFRNPSGLDEDEHYSTLRDLKWLATFALRKPEIAGRMGMVSETIRPLDLRRALTLTHTHALLHTSSKVLLGKTGTTPAAGQCLVSLVRGPTRDYVVIILQSRDRYQDMRTVLQAIAQLPA